MPKYEAVSKSVDGHTYVFVTRGRSKPFSDEEMEDFFADSLGVKVQELQEEEAELPTFKVNNHLRRIFSQDLTYGIKHCEIKYGASEAQIRAEARRLFPTQNLDVIIGSREK